MVRVARRRRGDLLRERQGQCGWPAGGGGVGKVRAEVCSQPTDACCMGGGACVGQLCCSVIMCDLTPPPPLAADQTVWYL